MDAATYYKSAVEMAGRVLTASGKTAAQLDELERQVLGSFCFGMLNGAAQEEGMQPQQVLAAQVTVLSQTLGYEIEQAVQFGDYLVQCTQPDFQPAVNAILHRGVEGYYQQKESPKKFEKNVQETLAIVESWR